MGQFEKIVVLAVLFTITVIVVASLSTQEEEPAVGPRLGVDLPREVPAQPRGTLPGARLPLGTEETTRPPAFAFETPAPRPEAPRPELPPSPSIDPLGADLVGASTPPAAEPGRGGGRSTLLLSADVADPAAAPADLPAGTILVRSAGLERTPHRDFMSFEPRAGDTFASLAERFYGNSARAALLRLANEGRRELRAGEPILVPIFDLARQEPERPLATQLLPSTQGERTYEVQEGESLWAIAKKHYGTGSRWPEIFDANQDVLRSADAVRAGMRLRIP